MCGVFHVSRISGPSWWCCDVQFSPLELLPKKQHDDFLPEGHSPNIRKGRLLLDNIHRVSLVSFDLTSICQKKDWRCVRPSKRKDKIMTTRLPIAQQV